MSLRTRLTLSVAVIVAAAVIGAAYASHYSTSRQLRAETDQFLRQRADRFTKADGGGPGGGGGGGGGRPIEGGGPPELPGGRGSAVEFDAVTPIPASDRSVASTTGGPGPSLAPSVPALA